MLIYRNVILSWFFFFDCHEVFGLNNVPIFLHILLGFLNVLAYPLRFMFLMVDPSFWATFVRVLFVFWYLPISCNWFEFDDFFGSPFAWLLLSCSFWSLEILPLVLLTCTFNLRVCLEIILGMRLIERCHLGYRNLTLILNDGKIVWKMVLDLLEGFVCNSTVVTLQIFILFRCALTFIILYFQKAVIRCLCLFIKLHTYFVLR